MSEPHSHTSREFERELTSLRDRIARYISAPLSPVEVRELPCDVSFRHCPESEWEIGSARIQAASVTHRGPTLGYRVSEHGSSVCYIPDHELGLGGPLDQIETAALLDTRQLKDQAGRKVQQPSPAAPAPTR